MKNKLMPFLILVAMLFTGHVHARASVPVINLENQSIAPSSGKAPALPQVKQGIINAGKAQNWQFSETDGKLVGTLVVRGKHTISVDIPYTTTSYSLLYRNCINMNYEVQDGVPLIHPNYNKWVQNLGNAIRLELDKL